MSEVLATGRSERRGARVLAALRRPRLVLRFAIPAIVIALGLVFLRFGGLHIDLEVYRFGIDALLRGGDLYGPLPLTANDISLPFLYPPFAALLLMPFALVPWVVAWPSLILLSALSIGVTLFVTAKALWPSGGTAGAVSVASAALPLAFLLEPVYSTIDYGQVNLLLMALVAVDCLLPRTRWPRGMLVGIAAAIKLTPAAFVVFFLLRGDRRAAGVAAATGIVATLLSFAILPETSLRFWRDNPTSVMSGAPFYTNQTFLVVLVRAGLDGPLRTVLWLLMAAVMLAVMAPVIRRASAPLALVTTAAVALLASPTSWSHHWVWVVPGVLVAAATAWRTGSRGWWIATAAMVFVYVMAPHTWGLPRDYDRELGWSAFQQVVGATFVWFTALLLVVLAVAHRRALRAALGRPHDPDPPDPEPPVPDAPAPARGSGADADAGPALAAPATADPRRRGARETG